MAEEAMVTDLLALTEKKVNMTLDDLIKMSRKNDSKKKRTQRRPIKHGWHPKGNPPQGNTRAQRYMDSRSAVRQGVLARRRSNFQGNQFPKTTGVAKKAFKLIKNRGLPKGNALQWNARAQRYMDSRPAVRQGALAQRRSNFQGSLFPKTTETAMKAANSTMGNKATRWKRPRAISTLVQRNASPGSYDGKMPKTLDALFANMKEQRMRTIPQLATRGSGRQNPVMSRQITRGNGRPSRQMARVYERRL